jgi:hypothetical protein
LFLRIVFLILFVVTPQARAQTVTARLERLAAATTHFATGDLVANRESDRRWPSDMIAEQRQLVAELRAIRNERESLTALLSHADPKIRVLALGALFMREDARDLPAIARLTGDAAPTFPLLQGSMNSAGALPLSAFEAPQTVGNVAQSMISFYMSAAFYEGAFEPYWGERSGRQRTAGWFLVRMRRATRQSTPLNPPVLDDVRRVLAEIDALPPAERAWTLLYVATGVPYNPESKLVTDAALTASLKGVGPEPLLKYLRGETPTDDPDLRSAGGARRRQHAFEMCQFILRQSPNLFRPSDADAILAAADSYRDRDDATVWFAASSRVRGLNDMERAAAAVKAEIQRIPIRGVLGARNQGILAFTLWQMRGPSEREFLTNWVYTAMATPATPDPVQQFFGDVKNEARPDTDMLLASVVRDPRFEQANWTVLSGILLSVNSALPVPFETQAIYNARSAGQDDPRVFANWRTLLRQHFARTP